MKQSIDEGLSKRPACLPGGLSVQRKAKYLYEQHPGDENPADEGIADRSAAYAYAVAEQNADNGTIVTAPTCGSLRRTARRPQIRSSDEYGYYRRASIAGGLPPPASSAT